MTATDAEPATTVEAENRAATAEPAAEVVEFTLGEERCSMDIDAVDSIVEEKQITRVPRAPDAVEGVMDLRGETTAVVDPKAFLSVGEGGDDRSILVLDRAADKQKIGLRVENVREVAEYPEEQVEENGDLEGIGSSAIESELVKGVIRKYRGEVEDGVPEDVDLVLWLDIAELIGRVRNDADGPE
jgi:purine-binding chemotaxis protein CheW